MEGLVYKIETYLLNFKVCYLFSPNGFLKINIKDSVKPNSINLKYPEFLNLLEFDLLSENKSFNNSDNYKIINNFKNIKNDFNLFKIVSNLIKTISEVVKDNETIKTIYPNLILYLNSITNINYKINTYLFYLKLTHFLGISLVSYLKENEQNYFNNFLLKLIYLKLEDSDKLNLNSNLLTEIRFFIINYYLTYLNYRLKI